MAQQNSKKYPFYFYLILISIPFLFFILLEFGLRVFNYGEDIPQWVKLSKDYPSRIILNPDICKKYFYNLRKLPKPWTDSFEENKKEGTFRVFALGESSCAGFPYHLNGSFPKEIQRRLEIYYPTKKIEVINLGITAISSYVISDLIDGIIEKEPDLIIIYTGHNEYYGAMGVASSESLGNNFWLVRKLISWSQLRTFQLINSLISKLNVQQDSPINDNSGTLMKKMAKGKHIDFKSDIYKLGIDQFENNMRFVLEKSFNSKIPVIFSTLTSNLKDQKPFISDSTDNSNSADFFYNKGKEELEKRNFTSAKQNFLFAKEHDLLRFRAPEEINLKIRSLSKEFGSTLLDIDSIFNSSSKYSITGDELFIDHLHPNIAGYRLIGKEFFKLIIKMNLLKTNDNMITLKQDENFEKLVNKSFPFTLIDTIYSNMKIDNLKSNWPFDNNNSNKFVNMNLKSVLEYKVAEKLFQEKILWENSHSEISLYYYQHQQYYRFSREINAIIEFAPYDIYTYKFLINKLIQAKEYELALPYLLKLDFLHSDDFSNKWLGIIFLIRNETLHSINYLKKSLLYNESDVQVLYNLAGAYYILNSKTETIGYLLKCLSINPNYKEAKNFLNRIEIKN